MLAKRYGPAVADDAAKAALDLQVPTYHFLKRYLARRQPARQRAVLVPCSRECLSSGRVSRPNIAPPLVTETPGQVRHRPGAMLSAGSQPVLPTVRFSPATTVSFIAAANIGGLGRTGVVS